MITFIHSTNPKKYLRLPMDINRLFQSFLIPFLAGTFPIHYMIPFSPQISLMLISPLLLYAFHILKVLWFRIKDEGASGLNISQPSEGFSSRGLCFNHHQTTLANVKHYSDKPWDHVQSAFQIAPGQKRMIGNDKWTHGMLWLVIGFPTSHMLSNAGGQKM